MVPGRPVHSVVPAARSPKGEPRSRGAAQVLTLAVVLYDPRLVPGLSDSQTQGRPDDLGDQLISEERLF